MEDPLISLVIPAFNEEDNISYVLDEAHRVLRGMDFTFEIIVVNDGSFDATAEAAQDRDIVLINHNTNLGKGEALKSGFVNSRGEYIVTMDADGSHRPEDLPRLIQLILKEDVDAVMGSRFGDETGKKSTTRLHIIGNKIINMMILFLTGRYISDSQSGFRAYKRDVLRKLALSSSRFEIEGEMTVRMLKKGLRVKEVPIRCITRAAGHSKVESFKDGFRILKAVLKVAFCS